MKFEKEFIRLLSSDNKKIALKVKSENLSDIEKSILFKKEEKEKILNLLKKLNLKENRFIILKDYETEEMKAIIISEKENDEVIVLEINFEKEKIKYKICKTKEEYIIYDKNITGKINQLNLEVNFNTLAIPFTFKKITKFCFLKEINYLLKDGKLIKNQPSLLTSVIIKDDKNIKAENFFTGQIIDIEKIKEEIEQEEKNRKKLSSKFMVDENNILSEEEENFIKN